MIDIKEINENYHVGREKPRGKVYVIGSNDAQIVSYSALTRTLEWYQSVIPEDMVLIEAYLKENY